MEVKMNTTDRKGLVKAIAEITGTTAAYKGAPTFAYEIGEYTIDRNSTLTFTDKTNADNQCILINADGLIGFAHDPHIYRIQTQLCQNTR